MSEQKIPEAAVEAAAQGMLAHSTWGDRWDDLSDLHKGWWMAQATSAIEAAAPHMPNPRTYSLEDVAAEFGIDLDELRKEEGAK